MDAVGSGHLKVGSISNLAIQCLVRDVYICCNINHLLCSSSFSVFSPMFETCTYCLNCTVAYPASEREGLISQLVTTLHGLITVPDNFDQEPLCFFVDAGVDIRLIPVDVV